MKALIDLIGWVSRAGAIMAAALVVAMTGHILVEIVLRLVFSRSTYVLEEFIGYGVAAATFMALGYTLESGGHIRVNLLLARLKRGWVRNIVELVCIAIALALTVFLWQFFWRTISRNWSRGAVSETIAQVPLWLPESFVLLGLSILALQLVGLALKILLLHGRTRTVQAEQERVPWTP